MVILLNSGKKQLKQVLPGKNSSNSKFNFIDIDTSLEIEENKTADYINNFFVNIGYVYLKI